jgi:hypothetical protein
MKGMLPASLLCAHAVVEPIVAVPPKRTSSTEDL